MLGLTPRLWELVLGGEARLMFRSLRKRGLPHLARCLLASGMHLYRLQTAFSKHAQPSAAWPAEGTALSRTRPGNSPSRLSEQLGACTLAVS